jgi:predicted transcriptional regulator
MEPVMHDHSPIRPCGRRHRILAHLETGAKSIPEVTGLEGSPRGHKRYGVFKAMLALYDARLVIRVGSTFALTDAGRAKRDELEAVRPALVPAEATVRVFGRAAA